MNIKTLLSKQTVTLIALAALVLLPLPAAANDELPIRLLARAGNIDGGETTLLDITISSWTPEVERDVLFAAIDSEEQSALRKALQKSASRGRIAARTELGIELRYAYRIERDNGSTVILAADRPINVEEAIDQGIVSRTYDTTVVVIELDAEGHGQGEVMLAANVKVGEDGQLEFVNVVPNPVRLTGVRVTSGP